MKKTITYCDICEREINPQHFHDQPRFFKVVTNCASQNPMERITGDNQYQENEFTAPDTCHRCMRALAETIASAIEKRRDAAKITTDTP